MQTNQAIGSHGPSSEVKSKTALKLQEILKTFDTGTDMMRFVTQIYLGAEFLDVHEKRYFSRLSWKKSIWLLILNGNVFLSILSLIYGVIYEDDGILNLLIRGRYLSILIIVRSEKK